MTKVVGIAIASVLVLGGGAVIWGTRASPAEPARPNVILISVDTLRADHLGCYGYQRPTSPSIDLLARRGVRFDQAFSQSSWTLPSHLSLLTSRYPHSHGVETDKQRLPDDVTTLAEALGDAGYSTHAFISWVYVSDKYGFGKGFDEYQELLPPSDEVTSSTEASIKASAFVDCVIEWAGLGPRQPFFLFLHLFDPHINYEPPAPFDEMFGTPSPGKTEGTFEYLRRYIKGVHREPERIPADRRARALALYDGEIRFTDHELGRLWTALGDRGLLDNSVIVFTSDHGEEFDDHGSMEGHQWTLYDEVLHIPLIMVFPHHRFAGRTVPAVAQLIDVAPTILDFLDLDIPTEFQGRSLLPLLTGVASDEPPGMAFSEIKRFNEKWAVRTPTHKLIYTKDIGLNARGVPVVPGYELYDTSRDPREQENIYEESDPLARELVILVRRWMETDPAPETLSLPSLDDRDLDRLRGLGYVE